MEHHTQKFTKPSFMKQSRPSASDLLQFEYQQEIKEAFELFDMNKDGKLDYHELKVAMKALGFEWTKQDILELMEQRRSSAVEGMSFEDFHRIMSQLIASRDPVEELRRAFRLFDDDGTGKITLENLRRVSRELGEGIF